MVNQEMLLALKLIITMIQITRQDQNYVDVMMSKTDRPLSKVASKMFEDDVVEYSSLKLTEQNLGKKLTITYL